MTTLENVGDCNRNRSLGEKTLLCFIISKIMIHILYFNKLENITPK